MTKSIILSAFLTIGISMSALASMHEEQPSQPRMTSTAPESDITATPADQKVSISDATSDLINAVAEKGKPVEQAIRHNVKPAARDAEKDLKKAGKKLSKSLKKLKKDKKGKK